MSIAEVAKLAGVSTATVSRVLNAHAQVNPETARQVRAAIRELGYRPRADRRRPVAGAGRGVAERVALLTIGQSSRWEDHPVLAATLAAIAKAARGDRLQVLLEESAGTEIPCPSVRTRAVSGVIVLAADDELVPVAIGGLPTVWVAAGHAPPARPPVGVDVVSTDDAAIGHLAAHHLTSRGHRTVAVVNPVPSCRAWDLRCRTFERSARAAGCRVHRYQPAAERREKADADPSVDPHETLAELIGRFYAEGPGATALFLPADSVCAAAYPMLARPGRRPGDGLDVVSCDHERVRLESLRPEPVTIDPGVEQIGRIAVRQLRTRSSAPDEPSARLLVAPRLMLPTAVR